MKKIFILFLLSVLVSCSSDQGETKTGIVLKSKVGMFNQHLTFTDGKKVKVCTLFHYRSGEKIYYTETQEQTEGYLKVKVKKSEDNVQKRFTGSVVGIKSEKDAPVECYRVLLNDSTEVISTRQYPVGTVVDCYLMETEYHGAHLGRLSEPEPEDEHKKPQGVFFINNGNGRNTMWCDGVPISF